MPCSRAPWMCLKCARLPVRLPQCISISGPAWQRNMPVRCTRILCQGARAPLRLCRHMLVCEAATAVAPTEWRCHVCIGSVGRTSVDTKLLHCSGGAQACESPGHEHWSTRSGVGHSPRVQGFQQPPNDPVGSGLLVMVEACSIASNLRHDTVACQCDAVPALYSICLCHYTHALWTVWHAKGGLSWASVFKAFRESGSRSLSFFWLCGGRDSCLCQLHGAQSFFELVIAKQVCWPTATNAGCSHLKFAVQSASWNLG